MLLSLALRWLLEECKVGRPFWLADQGIPWSRNRMTTGHSNKYTRCQDLWLQRRHKHSEWNEQPTFWFKITKWILRYGGHGNHEILRPDGERLEATGSTRRPLKGTPTHSHGANGEWRKVRNTFAQNKGQGEEIQPKPAACSWAGKNSGKWQMYCSNNNKSNCQQALAMAKRTAVRLARKATTSCTCFQLNNVAFIFTVPAEKRQEG